MEGSLRVSERGRPVLLAFFFKYDLFFRPLQPPTLNTVKGIVILDNDGRRVLANYYDKETFPTTKEQTAFEKSLFSKTSKSNAEVLLLDGMVILHRSNVDLFFYVLGGQHENELVLLSVLNCLYDSVSQILRKNVEKRALFEHFDVVLLALDEICDNGMILEADPNAVISRVAIRTDDIPIGEQTVAQVRQAAFCLITPRLTPLPTVLCYKGSSKDWCKNGCYNSSKWISHKVPIF